MRGIGGAILAAGLIAGCQPEAVDPHQWPVEVSRGQRFVNEEFGVSAIFPVGAAVCVTQSGSHHHGYYGRLGYPGPVCSPSKDTPELSVLAAWGDHNAAEYRTLAETQSEDCSAAASPDLLRPDGRPFGFPGLDSAVCRMTDETGRVTIMVTALAGRDPGQETPARLYSAHLSAMPGRLEADKVMFARFLDELVLTRPND